MRKLLFILLFLQVLLSAFSQQSIVFQSTVDELSRELLTNPENPLGIDQNFLLKLAQEVDNPQLSKTLQDYAANLQGDSELGYRQLYYDIANALEQNPDLRYNPLYAEPSAKLNLLFNDYNIFSNSIEKTSEGKYEFGMFVNDYELINGLTSTTGSYEAAIGIAAGIEMIADIAGSIEENQKLKDDYKKLAEISKQTVYAENDLNLPNALIDACLLVSSNGTFRNGNRITPLYRYDFKSGSSLKVENGVLKHYNASGKSKILVAVEKKHDGNFYPSSSYNRPILFISDDEKFFYLTSVSNAFVQTTANKSLEFLKPGGYIINSETGEIFMYSTKMLRPVNGGEAFVFKGSELSYFDPYNGDRIYAYEVNDGKIKDRYTIYYGDPNSKSFSFNSTTWYLSSLIQANGLLCAIQWPFGYGAGSSLIVANTDKSGYCTAWAMPQELTAMAKDYKGNVYVTTAAGKIARIDSAFFKINVDLITNIKKAFRYGENVSPYRWGDTIKYVSTHGSPSGEWQNIPRLNITPDGKYLVYTVYDSLYVINPDSIADIKRFGLNMHTYNFYFTRENGEWVLNIFGTNSLRFPVQKKYSLSKLFKIDTRPKRRRVLNDQNENTSGKENLSIADELKKLADLKQQGVLTQTEFDAAKAKLLGTIPTSSTSTTASTKKTTVPSKNKIPVLKFYWNGQNHFAVKAPSTSEFIGLYTYSGTEPCFGSNGLQNNEPGAPIINLGASESTNKGNFVGRDGRWQPHCAPALDVWWWLESDSLGTPKVQTGVNGQRYILVVQYKTGSKYYPVDSYNMNTLDKWTDGSNKIVILGERVKE